MRRFRKTVFVIGLAAASAIVLTGAYEASAHKGAKGIVKVRMDAMKSIGEAMKSMKKMFVGERPYDAKKVEAAAKVIETHAGKAMRIP